MEVSLIPACADSKSSIFESFHDFPSVACRPPSPTSAPTPDSPHPRQSEAASHFPFQTVCAVSELSPSRQSAYKRPNHPKPPILPSKTDSLPGFELRTELNSRLSGMLQSGMLQSGMLHIPAAPRLSDSFQDSLPRRLPGSLSKMPRQSEAVDFIRLSDNHIF